MGGRGTLAPPGFCKFQQKKVVFVVSSGKKTNFTSFVPPRRKMLEKSSRAPWKKILPMPVSLGLSCILQIERTLAPCQCWQRCRWTKLFGWNVTHCLKLRASTNHGATLSYAYFRW